MNDLIELRKQIYISEKHKIIVKIRAAEEQMSMKNYLEKLIEKDIEKNN